MKMRKDKNEKRRLAISKQNVRKEKNLQAHGTDNGAAVAVAKTKEVNKRVIAVVLALIIGLSAFVTSLVVFKAKSASNAVYFTELDTTDPMTNTVLKNTYEPGKVSYNYAPDNKIYVYNLDRTLIPGDKITFDKDSKKISWSHNAAITATNSGAVDISSMLEGSKKDDDVYTLTLKDETALQPETTYYFNADDTTYYFQVNELVGYEASDVTETGSAYRESYFQDPLQVGLNVKLKIDTNNSTSAKLSGDKLTRETVYVRADALEDDGVYVITKEEATGVESILKYATEGMQSDNYVDTDCTTFAAGVGHTIYNLSTATVSTSVVDNDKYYDAAGTSELAGETIITADAQGSAYLDDTSILPEFQAQAFDDNSGTFYLAAYDSSGKADALGQYTTKKVLGSIYNNEYTITVPDEEGNDVMSLYFPNRVFVYDLCTAVDGDKASLNHESGAKWAYNNNTLINNEYDLNKENTLLGEQSSADINELHSFTRTSDAVSTYIYKLQNTYTKSDIDETIKYTTVDENAAGELQAIEPAIEADQGLVLDKTLKQEEDGTYTITMEAYADAPIANKAVEDGTPLDIVMVMDQSSSMDTPDVWTGDYTPIPKKESYSLTDAVGKYVKVGDEYYLLKSDQHGYAPYQTSDGKEKTSWLASDASTASTSIKSNLKKSGKGLYYMNGENPVTVTASSVTKYTSTTTKIKASRLNHDLYSNHHYALSSYKLSTFASPENIYVYAPAENGKSCWHQVYYQEDGEANGDEWGFFYTFYYYTNLETSSGAPKITSGNAGDTFGSGSTEIKLLCSYHECEAWGFGLYTDITDPWTNSSSYDNGTDGKLYKTSGTGTNNYMVAGSYVLACPEPGQTYSHTYNGKLYTEGYQLYYERKKADGTIEKVYDFENNVSVYKDSDTAYTGTLYEKDTITRQKALHESATNFANLIKDSAPEDSTIAVVGYSTTGNILSGDKTAAGALVPAKSIDMESVLEQLTASGQSQIAEGLNQAANIFAETAPYDPADGRKRIVIVFTDGAPGDDSSYNPAAASNSLSAGAILKDTYNASIYTVGYYSEENNPDDTLETFLRELSSEYFTPTSGNSVATSDGAYYYRGYTEATLKEMFEDIAKKLEVPTTKVTLGKVNSVLKDYIDSNFNAKDATVEPATSNGTYSNGTISWSEPTKNPSGVNHSWDTNHTVLSVTGFDYNGNYINETHTSGQKLIVTIKGLKKNSKVKSDANKRVYSNTEESGLYKIGAEELLMAKFDNPYDDDVTNMAPEGGSGHNNGNGIYVNKYLTPNSNGKYDLTLEAYTTQPNEAVVEKIPTDFVVVVDQSGSMAEKDMPTGYKAVSGSTYLETIANGSYYYKAADGNYYRVYASRDYLYRYYPANYWYTGDLVNRFGTRLGWFMGNTESTTTFQNQMYFREVSVGQIYYQPITMTVQGKIGTYYIAFKYTNAAGKEVQFNRDDTTYASSAPWYKNVVTGGTMKSGMAYWAADTAVQALYPQDYAYTYSKAGSINTGMFINYPMYDRHVGYSKLCYRDVNGIEHTLTPSNSTSDTWEFCNDDGQALTSQTGSRPTYSGLYQASGTQSRLDALKVALNDFATAVASERDREKDSHIVENKIAIVGFSSNGYNNTEVLTGTNLNVTGKDGTQKSVADKDEKAHYGTALVSATENDTGTVNSKITNAINALTANGGTQPEDGLDMAYKILENRSEEETIFKEYYGGEVHDRNTIVIFFTDGHPGDYSVSDMYTEANEVVEAAKPIKAYKNTKVFSIGVFGESDGNPLTYPAHTVSRNNANSEYEYDPGWMETITGSTYYYLNRNWIKGNPAKYGATANDTIYDYMSVVSSNYPKATEFMTVKEPGVAKPNDGETYLQMVNRVRNSETASASNDYYRMASNQDTLVAAFNQAVTMMNSPLTAEQRLDAASVMKDFFSANFVASSSSSVSAATVIGKADEENNVTFKPDTATNVNVTAILGQEDGKTSVTVKGFDYLSNYINYDKLEDPDNGLGAHEGKKLVVTVTDVYPTGENAVGDKVFSNDDVVELNSDAINSAMYIQGKKVNSTEFKQPAISRHSYKLDVGLINKQATFNVTAGIYKDNKRVPKEDFMLDEVILVYPNGDRVPYSDVGQQTFENMKDGDIFYFENVPEGYQILTTVAATDEAYEYNIAFENGEQAQELKKEDPVSKYYEYDNQVIQINSVAGRKDVTIREQTIGDYANLQQVFDEKITMDVPVNGKNNEETTFRWPITMVSYHGLGQDIPEGASDFYAVFEKVGGTSAGGIMSTKLTGIQYTFNGNLTTWNLSEKNAIPMKTGDEIKINVDAGNTVYVEELDTYAHSLTYNYGQDDIKANDITLKAEDGTLLKGTYKVKLEPYEDISAPECTLKFVDGILVDSEEKIDIGQYYIVTDKEALENAKIDIAGKAFEFEKDDEGNYVATIKTVTRKSPISVTIDKTSMDILIINQRYNIPATGLEDDSHGLPTWVWAVVGALTLAAGASAIYNRRKRRLTN